MMVWYKRSEVLSQGLRSLASRQLVQPWREWDDQEEGTEWGMKQDAGEGQCLRAQSEPSPWISMAWIPNLQHTRHAVFSISMPATLIKSLLWVFPTFRWNRLILLKLLVFSGKLGKVVEYQWYIYTIKAWILIVEFQKWSKRRGRIFKRVNLFYWPWNHTCCALCLWVKSGSSTVSINFSGLYIKKKSSVATVKLLWEWKH